MYIRKYIYILAAILWLPSMVFSYLESSSLVKLQLMESIAKNELEITQLLDIAVAYNMSLKEQMDINIDFVSHEKALHPLLAELKNFPEKNAYGLEGNETVYNKPYESNLTGIGSLENVDFSTFQEINAALLLNLATAVKEKKHEFIWAYYTSNKGFLLLSPRIGIDVFNITESLYDKPFWQIAIPENNPEKETVISELYEDAGGQGWMISISTPIYTESMFRGVVSLDLGIKYLERVLRPDEPELDKNLLLVSKDGLIAAGGESQGVMIDAYQLSKEHKVSPYEFLTLQGDIILLSNPIREKFYVVYKIPRPTFSLLVIKNTFSQMVILTLVFVIFCFMIHFVIMLIKTRKLAQIDGLSQVYNRQALEDLSIKEYMKTKRRNGQMSVLMLDIDYFKTLNDIHGHKAGDNGIKHVAQIVSDSIRKSDIFGRYGGEEFLVTLPDANIDEAAIVAEKLRSAIEYSSFDQDLTLTVSIGCANFNASKEDIEFDRLCSNADKALYQAKQNGRNRIEKYVP